MQILPNKLYLAMNAAMFIAYNGNENSPVSGSSIVDFCNLNKRALESVLQKLSSTGLIVSIKGAKGGYYMPQPESMTLRDVVEAFGASNVPDKHEFAGYDTILDETLNACYYGWLDSLSDISFKRLCFRAKNSKIAPLEMPVLNYSI